MKTMIFGIHAYNEYKIIGNYTYYSTITEIVKSIIIYWAEHEWVSSQSEPEVCGEVKRDQELSDVQVRDVISSIHSDLYSIKSE